MSNDTQNLTEVDGNVNQEAANEQNGPEAELIECPACHNLRRKFLIVNGSCDSCRTRSQAAAIGFQMGWPEVRQRRNLLLIDTDRTQIADRKESIKNRFAPWRELLRDITKKSTPIDAWTELDRLEAERPSESD